jgi:hypothetical protein
MRAMSWRVRMALNATLLPMLIKERSAVTAQVKRIEFRGIGVELNG